MSFFGKLSRNLLLSVVSLLVVVLLLEFALRIYLYYNPDKAATLFLESEIATIGLELFTSDGRTWITQGDPKDYKFTVHPYLIYKNMPDQHSQEYNINSLGLRGAEVAIDKSPDVFRVVAIGGSTAFGYGATNDAGTWTYKLEQKLNACPSLGKRVEVLNASVIGYITPQELLYLQLDLLKFSPDLVIAFNGFNDFLTPAVASYGCSVPMEDPRFLDYPVTFFQVLNELKEHAREQDRPVSSRTWRLLVSMAMKTHVGKFFYKRIEAFKNPASAIFLEEPAKAYASAPEPVQNGSALDTDCVAAIAGNYKKNLQKMAWVLRARNISLLVALQPELSLKKRPSPTEKIASDQFVEGYSWYRDAIAIIYPEMANAAAAMAAETRTSFVDLTGVFGDRSEDDFIDECHLSDTGNEVVAQFLSDYICGKNLVHSAVNTPRVLPRRPLQATAR